MPAGVWHCQCEGPCRQDQSCRKRVPRLYIQVSSRIYGTTSEDIGAHTHEGDDLRLDLELTLESTGDEGDVAVTIVTGVGHVADSVEHGTADAGKDSYER